MDTALLAQIDSLRLSARNIAWREAVQAAPWRISADRERFTAASWRETEGEDIELRRAKLVASVAEGIELSILPFDEIAGRPTPWVIGCQTAIDVCGDYMPAIWNDDGLIEATLDASAELDRESVMILRESARVFGGRSAGDAIYRAWEMLEGTWVRDAEDGKLKDPTLDAGIFANTTSALNWDKILKTGISGYIAETEEKIRLFKENFASGIESDISKLYFWESALIVLNAAIRLSERYAELADSMAAASADDAEKARLRAIAATCRLVPRYPAKTIREAMQSMVIVNLLKMLENPSQNNSHWANADRYLYDIFKSDIASGVPLSEISSYLAEVIGRWGTQTFVSGASQKESHQINFGINNVMIAGKNADGTDSANELSYLLMHIVGALKLSSPTVCLRWNRNTPDVIMRKAIRTNLETQGGIPLFENDEIVVGSYVRDGIPLEEAVNWHSLGCVYPALPTRAEHYGSEGIAAFNLAAILDITLHGGRDINGKITGLPTENPREFTSFEQLIEAYFAQHRYISHKILRLGKAALDIEGDYLRLPAVSVLSLPCSLELGRDVLLPHPDYALFGISDRAIIDTADSLTAIKKLVFDDKSVTMDMLIRALDSNFDENKCPGAAAILRLCLGAPKYGNADFEADNMVKLISDSSAAIIREFDNAPYKNFMVAREGLAWHYYGGLGVGALPNGRLAREPLADGACSPMRGADTEGPTSVLHSALTADFSNVSYASVLNQKFSATLLEGEGSVDKLIAYTNTFLSRGGSHIQYNIVNAEELRQAKESPETHRDLIVRIGGFSAYFVQLSDSIQNDVILRSEFSL